MAIVKLKLRPSGQELHVTLTATNHTGDEHDTEGNLPPLPIELNPTQENSAFRQWQLSYREDEDVRSCASFDRLTPISQTIHSPSESSKYAQAVKNHLNQWLNSGDSEWLHIRDELVAICSQLNHSADDEIVVLLDAKNIDLCRLPWQEWNFFENHCPQAEIAFRLPKSKDHKDIIHSPSSSKVRILIAIGRNNDINTDRDLEEIKRLEKLGAEVKCLEQPNGKVLCDALWDQQGYHIFIFTGHSGSRQDGEIGWIELNDQESLSIEDFKNALKEAINRGLQLAIFNSCDGLGLANQLAQLHLPQSIVMREPVPDQVAVDFLKYFFQEFAHGSQSLFTSVHKSRQRLEHFKSRYPGVEWLPVICISHKGKKLPTWQNLCETRRQDDAPAKTKPIDTPIVIPQSTPTQKTSPSTPHLNRWKFIASCLALLVLGCAGYWWISHQPEKNFRDVSVPAGEWLFGGSTSWAKINGVLHPQIQQELPQIHLKYIQHPIRPQSSGTGIRMLLDNQIAFAQSSRHLKDSERKEANTKGFKLNDFRIEAAEDAIAIVVHRNLNIPGLTIQQLQDIYTGKITNWSQVCRPNSQNCGPSLKITPYSRSEESGTTEFFLENILGNTKFGSNVVFKPITTDIEKIIGQSDPGGIYYVSASQISKSLVKALPISRRDGGAFIAPQVDKYPIDRPLFVIIKQDGQRDEQIGKAYVKLLSTNEGQKLIKAALKPN